MSERTVSELREDIVQYCDTARDKKEIVAHMRGEDPDIIEALILDMAAKRQIMIAPGSSAKKWMSTAKVRAMMMAEGSE